MQACWFEIAHSSWQERNRRLEGRSPSPVQSLFHQINGPIPDRFVLL